MSTAKPMSRLTRILPIASLAFVFSALWPSAKAHIESAANVVPLIVRIPHGSFNRLTVSVTVCEPRTDRCATIDDVMVDKGSTGLRLEASAVPSFLRLPAFSGAEGKPLAECLRFVHDDAWGRLVRADLHMGGMVAADLPIQIIADDGRSQPTTCPVSTTKATSNGTLGIGPHRFDCQGTCEQDFDHPGVFVQEGSMWSAVRGSVPPESRVPNPVSRFGEHGNGVIIDLPAAPDEGADQVVGTLVFGVGTAPNSRLGAAKVIKLDGRGRFTTVYGGKTYADAYIDSGTETNILTDDGLPRCAGMSWAFCVSPIRALFATMIGADGAQAEVAFRIGDYRAAMDRRVGAWDGFAEAAEHSSKTFVWGAPFFLGRRVSVVQDGQAVPGVDKAVGPFYALR